MPDIVLLRTGIVALVERHFVERSRPFRSGRNGRSRLLNEFRPWLSRLTTHVSCPACVQGTPELSFPCGHVLCEACSKETGEHRDADPYLYTFYSCPVCERPCSGVALRVKPATAGLRVLSIDGGGIRAVIPLQFLRALEKAIGLDMPVQEHFDLAYGTSSGMFPRPVLSSRPLTYEEALWRPWPSTAWV